MIELGDEFVGIAPVAKDRIRHSTPAKPNQNKRAHAATTKVLLPKPFVLKEF
jgi:hypothetical protein